MSIAAAPATVPGGGASVIATTDPGAACSIEVILPSGNPSHASGLVDKAADAQGVVSWLWPVDAATRPGDARISVSCEGAQDTASLPIGAVMSP